MNDRIKITFIFSVAVLVIVGMFLYFSPYHSCARAAEADGESPKTAAYACAQLIYSGRR